MKDVSAQNPNIKFDVQWRPFFLREDSPLDGVNKREMYLQKFGGSEEKLNTVMERLNGAGQRAGIKFSLDGKVGNTLRSHRLVEWAHQQGGNALQDKVIEALFSGYFENAKDITSVDWLSTVAASVGLDQAQALEFLKSDQLVNETRQEE